MRYSHKLIIRKDAIKKTGRANVCLQVFLNGKRKVIPLGIDVEPKFFYDDGARQFVKIPRKKRESNLLSATMLKASEKALNIFRKAIYDEQTLTRQLFAEKFLS